MLTDLLRDTVSDTVPRPDLLHDVRRGGRRRLLRRRAAGATALALAVTGTALAVPPLLRTPPHAAQLAGTVFDGRVHGDLAGDAGYLREVLTAWDGSHDMTANRGRGLYDDLRGPAHVVWAGTTPAGPAAVVEQEAFLHPHDASSSDGGLVQLLGFLASDGPGRLHVVADSYPGTGSPAARAWYVDPAKTVLAVLDEGAPLGVSTAWTYTADGQARRRWTPLVPVDGVASLRLPTGSTPYLNRIARQPFRRYDDLLGIANVDLTNDGSTRGLTWVDTARESDAVLPVGGVRREPDEGRWIGRLIAPVEKQLEAATDEAALTSRSPVWAVTGRSADGTTLTIVDRQLDDDPAHLYLSYGGSLRDEGPVDAAATLPVAVHLPGGQGWVVAQYHAALRYRIRSGQWVAVGRDAALLPEGATEVEVTLPGRASATVPLRR